MAPEQLTERISLTDRLTDVGRGGRGVAACRARSPGQPVEEPSRDRAQDAHVTLPDGTAAPALGMGTWYLGEDPGGRDVELDALGRASTSA